MSARPRKRKQFSARDSERLRFLIDCMSDEELIRHGLMRADRERPRIVQLLSTIDLKLDRYRRAHARLTGSKTKVMPREFGAGSFDIIIDDR